MKYLSVWIFSLFVRSEGEVDLDLHARSRATSSRGSADSSRAKQTTPPVAKFLEQFGKMPGLSASFREEKRMALLAAPLINEGTVYYAQGKLVRHTLKPTVSSVLVSDGKLEFLDGTTKKSLDVDSHPLLRHFVATFAMILGGDHAGLAKSYRIRFSKKQQLWTMKFEPIRPEVAKIIAKIILRGKGLVLAEMNIQERSGDSTTMRFSNVNVDRYYTNKEMRKIFRVGLAR